MTEIMKQQKEQGFSLLELLVALLLIALGIVGMIALQTRALQYSSAAFYQGMGIQVANGLAANIRANPAGSNLYTSSVLTYSPGSVIETVDSCSTACTPAKIAAADVVWARRSVRQLLPEGDIFIKKDGSDFVEVILVWEGAETKDGVTLSCSGMGITTTSAENPQCLAVKVRI